MASFKSDTVVTVSKNLAGRQSVPLDEAGRRTISTLVRKQRASMIEVVDDCRVSLEDTVESQIEKEEIDRIGLE